jgi:hypothetical protein
MTEANPNNNGYAMAVVGWFHQQRTYIYLPFLLLIQIIMMPRMTRRRIKARMAVTTMNHISLYIGTGPRIIPSPAKDT